MIQLKIRTEYSFGSVFGTVDSVIERGKALGCKAMGMVDSTTWGHVAWFKACSKVGIQPLLGVEAVVSDTETPLHMWFLAKNKHGLSELYRFISKSYGQTLKTRGGAVNRLFRHDVQNMSENILKFAGEVTDRRFLSSIAAYADLSPASLILNAKKRSLGLPVVSISDNAFPSLTDRETFEFIGNLKVTSQHILPELEHQDQAQTIADSCSGLELPKTPMLIAEGDLRKLCQEGIRFRRMKWNLDYETRLDYELNLIASKNFESYFIIVADMVHYAKKHMLVGPSRGSAAGSLVCYLLRITEINPMGSGLYFERFIDINRSDLPDIDLDFPDDKRQMVFDYMSEKYGDGSVAHIGTISKYRPKSALIHVCKALGIPPTATGAVKTSIIERMPADARFNNCLEDTFKETDAGKDFIKDYPQAIAAISFEGHSKHTGVHAAGLLVCDDAIDNYAVVDNKGIAHVEKGAAEDVGLLKIDILGLRTLTILEEADVDWYNLPLDDPKVFDVFNSGNLCGIFQFEGRALRNVSRDVEFKSIDDINIVTALARPGPLGSGIDKKFIMRKNGAPYDVMLPALEETYGLPIYQEQTMAIVRQIGNFSWAETIEIRKAIAKSKGKEAIDKYLDRFIKGAAENGINEKKTRKIWSMINEMGAYQMNKAHTFSYAVISYWTAYFKAYYPLEFAAANLRNSKDDDSAIMLLREMKREGIEYVPFDLEKSETNWCVKDGMLYGGFTALKGVGEIKAAKFIENRDNLTPKQIAFLENAPNPFSNIFPFHTVYQHLYDDPDGHGIADDLCDIKTINKAGDVPHHEERVFLAELTYKKTKNENDAARVKKRGGQKWSAPLDYIDVRLRDDTDEIGGRVGRFDFKRLGNLPDTGAHLLVRAKFFNDIPWAFITKWKRIDV
ncbi:DNA polymerase III subunit alpha [Candidatus Pacearchaeota archaeon]|nr:DNA polymerase III subunit alpha [Candidatus Pacearchaeota archaeon]